jgi:hypothetical protein
MGDGHVTAPVSRFLAGPVAHYLAAETAARAEAEATPDEPPGQVDLKARMRAIWQ